MKIDVPVLLTFSLSLLLRSLVALHPHSGQNNHHGSATAYGGDFEAQRHWMEITFHLKLNQWYTHDKSYWGLDYPPLTAYGSYALGWLSQVFVGEASVALHDSRGYEDATHKAFMRFTVMLLDCVFYFPFVYIIMKRLHSEQGDGRKKFMKNLSVGILGVLIQPSLVIIDHGHFQYNSVCLGLALGSFHYMTLDDKEYDKGYNNTLGKTDCVGFNAIIGSVLFCLALNWKQMVLYYSPAVFAYLLGKCFRSNSSKHRSIMKILTQVGVLGVTVITTFVFMWYPFYHYRRDTNETMLDTFLPIIRRIFPFSRGLFEGKVANLWCVASLQPISIRKRIPIALQPPLALGLTLVMILPFCILLFRLGQLGDSKMVDCQTKNISSSSSKKQNFHLKALLWGAAGTSISFFLASFQVHEKSILLPLAPLSMMIWDAPVLTHWFGIVSMWSMWHLVAVDRLQVAYFCCVLLYICYIFHAGLTNTSTSMDSETDSTKWKELNQKGQKFVSSVIIPISASLMIMIHILEVFITPPHNRPDLFPVIFVIVSCLSFCFAWLAFLWELLKIYLLILYGDSANKISSPTLTFEEAEIISSKEKHE